LRLAVRQRVECHGVLDSLRPARGNEYKRLLAEAVFGRTSLHAGLVSFCAPRQSAVSHESEVRAAFLRYGKGDADATASPARGVGPERMLDAPLLINDFYLNPLDWSKTNVVAIGICHTHTHTHTHERWSQCRA